MRPETYADRQMFYENLNFAGTSDWAIDLNASSTAGDEGELYDPDDVPEDYVFCDYARTFASLDELQAVSGGIRQDCLATYTLQVLKDMLNQAYSNFTAVNNGYDELFGSYVTYMKKLIPEIEAYAFMFNQSQTTPSETFPALGPGLQCK